jgi:hypothetical protein
LQRIWYFQTLNLISIIGLISKALVVEDILYVVGAFGIFNNDTSRSTGKWNLTSKEWLYIVNLEGIVYDITVGTVGSSNASIYVVGNFEWGFEYNSVAGLDSSGNMCDDAFGGWKNDVCLKTLFMEGKDTVLR